MKKFLLLLCVVVLLLTGYQKDNEAESWYIPQTGLNTNYNSVGWCGLTQNAYYYQSRKGLGYWLYAFTQDGEQFLTPRVSGPFYYILPNENRLCLLALTSKNSNTALYFFDTATKKVEFVDVLGTAENDIEHIVKAYILDNTLYYIKQLIDEKGDTNSTFYAFSLDSKESTLICEDVIDVGVVGDRPVYIVWEGDRHLVYSYDAKSDTSSTIGDLKHTVLQIAYNTDAPLSFQYTSDRIVVIDSPRPDDGTHCSSFYIYDLSQETFIAEYAINSGYKHSYCSLFFSDYNFSAYEDYAFFAHETAESYATTGADEDTNWEKSAYDLFRMRLGDGTTERIATIAGSVSQIYTNTDDEVYVWISDDDGWYIRKYSSDGSFETVLCDK